MFDFFDDIAETAKEVAIAATSVTAAAAAITVLVNTVDDTFFDNDSCPCQDDLFSIEDW